VLGRAPLGAIRPRKFASDSVARLNQVNESVESAFDLRSLAEAAERESALLQHLNAHKDYYLYALWNALPLSAQAPYLAKPVGAKLSYFNPKQ
jgi:hypothetical protein